MTVRGNIWNICLFAGILQFISIIVCVLLLCVRTQWRYTEGLAEKSPLDTTVKSRC